MIHIPLKRGHWAYVWVPIVTAGVWFGMLWAMLIVWLASGQPKYVSQEARIAYISDIGASYLKPLFIAGCAVTGVGFSLCLVIERYLRHSARLMPHMRRREKWFSSIACLGALIAACGLILLSVFDTKRYEGAHRVFLLVFIVGVAISAIFTIVEYRWISKDYAFERSLRIAYWAKFVLVTILIVLAIPFGITLFVANDAGAVLEWLIAFIFTFYVLTYFFDLRLSKGRRRGEMRNPSMVERRHDHDGGPPNGDGAP